MEVKKVAIPQGKETYIMCRTEDHNKMEPRPGKIQARHPQESDLYDADNTEPITPMRAIALLSTLRSADIVLPITCDREIRLQRITEPTADRNCSGSSA